MGRVPVGPGLPFVCLDMFGWPPPLLQYIRPTIWGFVSKGSVLQAQGRVLCRHAPSGKGDESSLLISSGCVVFIVALVWTIRTWHSAARCRANWYCGRKVGSNVCWWWGAIGH
jgi:hypothetical protein